MSDSVSAWIWVALTFVIGLIWIRRHFDINRAHRDAVLTPADANIGGDLPALSLLVAAKDEEENIARCAEGLLAQDYPKLELFIINDRSDDRTGAIIDELAARDSRLTALHISELPSGWFGKNNAMRAGVERATGQWLCFSDADCAYDSPKLLAAAVRFATREKIEFLSVLPRLETHSFWERVVQPVASAILVYWHPPQKVNDPRARVAYANGAFMLLSRDAYQRIGGHEAVKATLNEDMHMARRAKSAGVRLHVIRGGEMFRVRMYSGFRDIWRGWSRIFYGCFGTPARLVATLAILALISLSPFVTLALSPLMGTMFPWLAAAAGFTIVMQQTVLWRFYRISGLAPPWALCYPLGALLVLGITLNAIRRAVGGATTTWRGTTYRGGS